MILLVVTVSALFGGIQTLTPEDAHHYMQSVLQGKFPEEANYNHLEPYKAKVYNFTANTTNGERRNVSFWHGTLMGLSMPTCRNCSQPLWNGPNITFACSLGFDNLRLMYMVMTGVGEDSVLLDREIRGTDLRVQVTSNSELNIPTMRSLVLRSVGTLISPSDNQIQDQRLRETVERTAQRLANQNVEAMFGRFKSALAYSIYKIPIPIIPMGDY